MKVKLFRTLQHTQPSWTDLHPRREFPTVETFVNDKAEAFGNLEVVYRFGSFPRLLLKDEAGHIEMLRIDKWKTEAIEEFLRNKLVASTATL